jgi:hypothetical protein
VRSTRRTPAASAATTTRSRRTFIRRRKHSNGGGRPPQQARPTRRRTAFGRAASAAHKGVKSVWFRNETRPTTRAPYTNHTPRTLLVHGAWSCDATSRRGGAAQEVRRRRIRRSGLRL